MWRSCVYGDGELRLVRRELQVLLMLLRAIVGHGASVSTIGSLPWSRLSLRTCRWVGSCVIGEDAPETMSARMSAPLSRLRHVISSSGSTD